jgi:chromosome segregation ATPase
VNDQAELIDRLENEGNSTKTELADARTALVAKVKQLRKQLEQAEAYKAQTLEDLKNRNHDIAEQYSVQLAAATQENSELKTNLMAKIAELKNAQESFAELKAANTELLTKQQTLSYRVAELTQAIEREKESSVAKQKAAATSVKAQSDATINSLTQKVDACRRVLVSVLTDEFAIPTVENDIGKLIEQTKNEIARRTTREAIFADCMRTRRAFGWENPLVSLLDKFTANESAVQKYRGDVDVLEGRIRTLESGLEAARGEIARLEQNKTEISQWGRWSRALLAELAGPTVTAMPVESVQMLLEEACLSSVGSRSQISKMALLRDQKKLLTNPRFNHRSVFVGSVPRQKIGSLRPAIVAILTLRRIQGMSGLLTMHFPTAGINRNAAPQRQETGASTEG